MQENFELLRKRKIIDILIGDTVIEEKEKYKIKMPYLSGNRLCEISTEFGLAVSYSWSGGSKSRWAYMDDLLSHLILLDRADDLLAYLFGRENFDELHSLNTPEEIGGAYKDVIRGVIGKINTILFLGGNELQVMQNRFYIIKKGSKVIVEAPKVNLIDMPYIQGLRERSKEDLIAGNYDSVITKSRTLIEEVLIYILEVNTIEIQSKGDLNKLYNQVKTLFNMRQDKGYDGRINSLLSGLEKVVMSIAEMRNVNSDAHGVGSKRIEVREHEALLVVNSAITFAEYILSIHNNKVKKP